VRVLIQRVSEATVHADSKVVGTIQKGMHLLVGITDDDTEEDISWLHKKILNMRIFEDAERRMNHSLIDIKGSVLIVSQFTLFASTKKVNRPSFTKAAKPNIAIPLYEDFIAMFQNDVKVETGSFGADMKINLVNDGPVSIWLDSKERS